jgi:hypothetical protein
VEATPGKRRPPDPRSLQRREPVDLEADQGSGGQHERALGNAERGDRSRAAKLHGQRSGFVDQPKVTAARSLGEQVVAEAADQVVRVGVLVGQPDGGWRVDEPEVRRRAPSDRIGADGNHLLCAITDVEEGTDPEGHPRDQPPLAAEPKEPPVAAADQPVVVNDVEKGAAVVCGPRSRSSITWGSLRSCTSSPHSVTPSGPTDQRRSSQATSAECPFEARR